MRIAFTLAGVFSIYLFGGLLTADAQYYDITRASESLTDGKADGSSSTASIDSAGRYLVFDSAATNIVANDTNGVSDIFLRDCGTDSDCDSAVTTRVSLDTGSANSNGASSSPVISANGNFVAYVSQASDLVSADTNSKADIFVYNRAGGTNSRVSVSSGAVQADGDSSSPAISDDGRYVAFASAATNLVSSDTNGFTDIFVFDRNTNITTRVSVATDSTEADGDSSSPVISADGRYVAFASSAFNLVGSDTNGKLDIFVRDTNLNQTSRISLSSADIQSNGDSLFPSISDDGSLVAFESAATNLVTADTNGFDDIFVRNITGGTTSRVSVSSASVQANGNSFSPSISGDDGRYVSFESDASNLVSGDTNGLSDVFVYDRTGASISRVSVSAAGVNGNGGSGFVFINDDARFTVFASNASNFAAGDTNNASDIFVMNGECLYGGFTAGDKDGDSTDNCSDGCGDDPLKTAPGTCGCGVAETDSDSDGTADCEDGCASDAAKTAAGQCGCGVADTDANLNGVADCNDPTNSTKPGTPHVTAKSKKGTAAIVMDAYSGVKFKITLKKNGSTFKTKTVSSNAYTFKGLTAGSYKVSYVMLIGSSVTTLPSNARKFTIN